MEEGAGDDSDIEVLSLGSGASHPPAEMSPPQWVLASAGQERVAGRPWAMWVLMPVS